VATYKLKLDEHLQDVGLKLSAITDARTNFLRTLSKIVAACFPKEAAVSISPDRAAHYTSLPEFVNTRFPGFSSLSNPNRRIQRRNEAPP
jgi:hypothetical protein